MMQYKGYRAAVTFDDAANVFHGEVVGTRDVITFEGTRWSSCRRNSSSLSTTTSPSVRSEGGNPTDPTPARYRFGSPQSAPRCCRRRQVPG